MADSWDAKTSNTMQSRTDGMVHLIITCITRSQLVMVVLATWKL